MGSSGVGEGVPAPKKSRTEEFYGDKELSDVVLQVGDVDLHVHKMFLAVKSPYFKQLFFAKGSKEKKTFVIDEDSAIFTVIMEVIYNHLKNNKCVRCSGSFCLETLFDPEEAEEILKLLYKRCSAFHDVLNMSEKYGVFEDARTLVMYRFRFIDCRIEGCLACTMRTLLALHYNFPNLKEYFQLDNKCMVFCLKRVRQLMDTFNIQTSTLAEILGHGLPARQTEPPDDTDNASEADGPIVVEYGDASLSDVTIVMGKYEFKVHKMWLANCSAYFRAMFFSGFKEKDKDRVVIEADGEAFKLMVELLYRNDLDDSDFLECRPDEPLQSVWLRVMKFWKAMPEIMKALEFFSCPSQIVEKPLMFHYCRKDDCVECANKKIFAMIYNLDNLKKKVTSTPITIASCITNFTECLPEQLSFAPNELAELIESLDEK